MQSWEDKLEEEVLTPTSLMGGGGGSLAHVLQYAGREVEEEKEFFAFSYVEQPGNINKTADQVLVLKFFVFYPRESGVDTLAVRSRLMHKMHVKINVTSISFWPLFLLFGNITNSSTALTLVLLLLVVVALSDGLCPRTANFQDIFIISSIQVHELTLEVDGVLAVSNNSNF